MEIIVQDMTKDIMMIDMNMVVIVMEVAVMIDIPLSIGMIDMIVMHQKDHMIEDLLMIEIHMTIVQMIIHMITGTE